jgi:hypothetical protein
LLNNDVSPAENDGVGMAKSADALDDKKRRNFWVEAELVSFTPALLAKALREEL